MSDSTELHRLFEAQRANAPALRARTAGMRSRRLRALRDAVVAHREALKAAMWADFRKPPESVDGTEILPVAFEARHAARNVARWMRPRRAHTPLYLFGTASEVRYEPKGTALILAPWNYPVNLTLGPLVAAVAAGCPAVVKPSEFVPNTSGAIADVVASVFPPEEAVVVQGGPDTAGELLRLPFDHIYFTGSSSVGRLVMRAAAEHLASVTLELGGKSPTIVDETADIGHAARTIAFAKFANCGQTCIAPDHVYVQEGVFDRFAELLIERIQALYGTTVDKRLRGSDYGRIVSGSHAERLNTLVREAVARGARLLAGGPSSHDPRFIDPTLLVDVPSDAPLMREEIFGPVLPLIRYVTLDDVLTDVRRRPKPLALYVYSGRREHVERVLGATSAGATVINDAMIHFLNLDLPFGGVGESGQGKGKGRAGFLAFSNERAVMRQRLRPPLLSLLYPPFTRRTRRLLDWLLRLF